MTAFLHVPYRAHTSILQHCDTATLQQHYYTVHNNTVALTLKAEGSNQAVNSQSPRQHPPSSIRKRSNVRKQRLETPTLRPPRRPPPPPPVRRSSSVMVESSSLNTKNSGFHEPP